MPPTPDKALPTAYALAPVPLPDPPVLAKVGDKVVLRTAGGTEWATLAEGAPKAEHLRLEVLRSGAVWAVWADPDRGLQFKAVQ